MDSESSSERGVGVPMFEEGNSSKGWVMGVLYPTDGDGKNFRSSTQSKSTVGSLRKRGDCGDDPKREVFVYEVSVGLVDSDCES